ncbi:MAG: hypothetical protein IPP08_07235 [Chlorobiota bacterium]|nr:MAG: hypothetical protein IPP08_07235 [Chlorobiota bacterium]
MNNIEEIISAYLDNELPQEKEAELHQLLSENEEDRVIFRQHIKLQQLARESQCIVSASPTLKTALFTRLQMEEGMTYQAKNALIDKPELIENVVSQPKVVKSKFIWKKSLMFAPFVVASLFGTVVLWKSFVSNPNISSLPKIDKTITKGLDNSLNNDLSLVKPVPDQGVISTNLLDSKSPVPVISDLTTKLPSTTFTLNKQTIALNSEVPGTRSLVKFDSKFEKTDSPSRSSSQSNGNNRSAGGLEVASIVNENAKENSHSNMTPSLPTSLKSTEADVIEISDNFSVDTGGPVNKMNFTSFNSNSLDDLNTMFIALNNMKLTDEKLAQFQPSEELRNNPILLAHRNELESSNNGLSKISIGGNGLSFKPSIKSSYKTLSISNNDFIKLLVSIVKSKRDTKGKHDAITAREVLEIADSLLKERSKK